MGETGAALCFVAGSRFDTVNRVGDRKWLAPALADCSTAGVPGESEVSGASDANEQSVDSRPWGNCLADENRCYLRVRICPHYASQP